jgi:hypothetical protein
VLTLALGITALLAGVTGTWLPCGFSMVDTLGSRRKVDGTAAVLVACGTFAIGALLGACALYGGLAAVGGLLDTAGRGAPGVAAVVVLVAAALGELRGVRIRPQVRRQVPEPWRRTMPLPIAAGLYGVLLGLGFATFVLTLAVAALAAVCLALGHPVYGLVVGVGFGAGRALPVAILAPLYGTRFADRALDLMAERPVTLRGLRLADGVALGCARWRSRPGPHSPPSSPAGRPIPRSPAPIWRGRRRAGAGCSCAPAGSLRSLASTRPSAARSPPGGAATASRSPAAATSNPCAR